MIHDKPVCLTCHNPIDLDDAIFASVCIPGGCHGGDHQRCPSMAFHPLCLMNWNDFWNDKRTEIAIEIKKMMGNEAD